MNKQKHHISGKFDTALVNKVGGSNDGTKGMSVICSSTIQYEIHQCFSFAAYGVVHIKVIFSIPKCFHAHLFNPGIDVPNHLAYVEWYSPWDRQDLNHKMFKITSLKDSEGTRICSIIPLTDVQWSVHLIPCFGPVAPASWMSGNVLDKCNTFFLNDFTDRHWFQHIMCSQ